MTMDEVKNYLKIDYNEDDTLIENMYKGCIAYLEPILKYSMEYDNTKYNNFYEYLEGENDKRLNLVNIYILAMTKEMYDDKGLTIDKANSKLKYTMSHILNQLQYSY